MTRLEKTRLIVAAAAEGKTAQQVTAETGMPAQTIAFLARSARVKLAPEPKKCVQPSAEKAVMIVRSRGEGIESRISIGRMPGDPAEIRPDSRDESAPRGRTIRVDTPSAARRSSVPVEMTIETIRAMRDELRDAG